MIFKQKIYIFVIHIKIKKMSSEFFKWDDSFSTNIPAIDVQHKVIVKVLNKLHDVIVAESQKEKMADIIDELVQYTIYHFGEEEKLFAEYNFNLEKSHIVEHKEFVNKIKDISKRFRKGEEFVAFDLINFLKDWLIDHILISDQKYAEFFKQKNIKIFNND